MDALAQLFEALKCLPSVGPKTAQRMAYHLLQSQRSRGLHLAKCLTQAMENIGHCRLCHDYTENEHCSRCLNSDRDEQLLCVVESPADILAIEQSQAYRGHYFVLMGKISPLDGIGPEDIALDKLLDRLKHGQVQEVILALSPTVEGQTTVHYIQSLLAHHPVTISQLAHGIPMGGELDLLDAHTINRALMNRGQVSDGVLKPTHELEPS